MNVIPINSEKYISFTKHVKGIDVKLRFIDSLRFLNCSLEKLASYLSNENKRILRSHFPNDKEFDLLTRKGIFPYDYITEMNILNERNLPTHDKFYNKMNDTNVSLDDYNHAINVFNVFKCSTIGEYSDLYLKSDVILLADIFENFRNTLIKTHGLDPAHYFTLPGYTWDCSLKHTKIELELLTDIDHIMFVEKGIRGGLSQCSNRYGRANNKYMDNYNPSEPSKYLMYLDINNMYGWAMCEPLPYSGFQWLEKCENFNFENIPDDSEIGYILEVDVSYPNNIHDLQKDLPMLPERVKSPGSKHEKLLATLYNKSRYVVHYRNLKQAKLHGVQIDKIHRVLEFKQSPWLKSYINLNNDLRKLAVNDFEKHLYKLMNNAVFGKTMENVRKRVNIQLKNYWDGRYGLESLISKPNFHRRVIFDENLVAIELKRLFVLIDKPIYVGMCILDISKTLIYSFHYDYILPKFKNNAKVLYTDTDSLIYEFKCDDIYQNMKDDIHRFDTSDYPENNRFGMPRCNKKVLGLMKDECSGCMAVECVCVRSKLYGLRMANGEEQKKAKGVKTSVVKKTITFDDYLNCLMNYTEIKRKQITFRSKNHDVFTIEQEKIALNPFDDKRFLIKGSTDTLPWGHYKIMEIDEI